MVAYIMSGYVNAYCPVGDGNRTLVRMSGPGEVIGYPDYVDERGRTARLFEAQAASKCTLALFSRDHLEAVAGPSSDRSIDHDPHGTEYFLVEESLVLYYPVESSSFGPAHDRHERFGEAGRRKRLAGDSADSGDLP